MKDFVTILLWIFGPLIILGAIWGIADLKDRLELQSFLWFKILDYTFLIWSIAYPLSIYLSYRKKKNGSTSSKLCIK